MSQYTIRPDDKAAAVEREGIRPGLSADKETAEQYVFAHKNIKRSHSGRFASPAEVLSEDTKQR